MQGTQTDSKTVRHALNFFAIDACAKRLSTQLRPVRAVTFSNVFMNESHTDHDTGGYDLIPNAHDFYTTPVFYC